MPPSIDRVSLLICLVRLVPLLLRPGVHLDMERLRLGPDCTMVEMPITSILRWLGFMSETKHLAVKASALWPLFDAPLLIVFAVLKFV